MAMHEGRANESDGRGIGSWIAMILGTVLLLYLLSFTVLVVSPRASRAVQTMGLSNATLEKIYYPILRFLR